MKVTCDQCGKTADLPAGHVNRSRRVGMRLFCGRVCSGLGRRGDKDKAQKVAEKAAYDREYRERNRAMLKAKKRAYFERTYDPVKAAVERKKKMPRHVEYCRRPEYKAYKKKYDEQYRAEKNYGPLADASLLLRDLFSNINQRMTHYEIRSSNQAVRNPQTRSAQESICTKRNRNRSAQGNGT